MKFFNMVESALEYIDKIKAVGTVESVEMHHIGFVARANKGMMFNTTGAHIESAPTLYQLHERINVDLVKCDCPDCRKYWKSMEVKPS